MVPEVTESMNNIVVEEAARLQELLESQGWDFCFIGGVAYQAWGEPRVTEDMDLTLFTGFSGEDAKIDVLLEHYTPRRDDARTFARTRRVLLLESDLGVGIDISLGGLDFEREAVSRAQRYEYLPGVYLRICTAEDLIVMKAFADREIDRHDLRSILIRQRVENLDWPYIEKHLTMLSNLKEEPAIMDRLLALRERVRGSEP